jgi:hypothetical protein
MSLMLDASNSTNAETVVITSINSLVIGVTPLLNSHVVNAPIVNVTQVNDYLGPASRWFDGVTNVDAGFGYESVTETIEAIINNDGYISIPLSKPTVAMSDVVSATFQPAPLDAVDTLILAQGWVIDSYFLDIAPTNGYNVKSGLATISYQGGFNPLPLDIVQAVTVMAARFYKEKDSGYSDVIGSSETGTLKYQKAMPADVAQVVNDYTRWV